VLHRTLLACGYFEDSEMLRTILPGLFCCKSFCNYAGAVNKPFVKVSDAVRSALNNQKPVVALESTIITHGMPFPDNFRCSWPVFYVFTVCANCLLLFNQFK